MESISLVSVQLLPALPHSYNQTFATEQELSPIPKSHQA
jgi:hypothetical protein